MQKHKKQNAIFYSAPPNPIAVRTLKEFTESRRHVVRGISTDIRRSGISLWQVNEIRNNENERDMMASAVILEAGGGLRGRRVTGVQQSDARRTHALEVRNAQLEAVYAGAFVSAWENEALSAIETICELGKIHRNGADEAASAIMRAAQTWGASMYMARKITYLKECFHVEENLQAQLDEIDKIIGHDKYPQLQSSALENLKDSMSIFSAARRHTSVFKDQARNGFRRIHYLNNLVPTPFSLEDCGGFILRAVETSLLDTVHSILLIFNIEDRFPSIAQALRRSISPLLLSRMLAACENFGSANFPNLPASDSSSRASSQKNTSDREDDSLSIYRRSASFLEYPQLCRFRNDIDRVIGYRLIAVLLPNTALPDVTPFGERQIIMKNDEKFDMAYHNTRDAKVDTFYRTYLFLRFILEQKNISTLTSADIQYIFDKTENLESLLLERELACLHLGASDEARALIAVLALALYRNKSAEPDVDFNFRSQLEDFIIDRFDRSVPLFIGKIAPNSPQVANYITSALDEVTLQKMYRIVRSASAAAAIRRQVLLTMGARLNRIEYIIEAEGIETRSKVAKLQGYFDTSRMFVDSVAMKAWLVANTSAYVEQYKDVSARMAKVFSRSAEGNLADREKDGLSVIELSRAHERLVEQIAGDAFQVFCTNNEFGIESYLARRIRHNTLQGIMTSSIDDVLKDEIHRPIIYGTPLGRALSEWEIGYRTRIERMRKDLLQFRSDSKPSALFNSSIDIADTTTQRNIRQLAHTLLVSGQELLHELVISFCWQQIAPQLELVARYIRVSMYNEIAQSLEQTLARFLGVEEQKLKSSLIAKISSVLTKVASWFQVPQTGYVSASIADVCKIIDMEHGRSKASTSVSVTGPSAKYFGISVHRLYDCLAVLLHNAFKHGRADSEVNVNADSKVIDGTSLHELKITVVSELPSDHAEICMARLAEAVTAAESSDDLVREGYSGIKKVKVITKMNEGVSTLAYEPHDTYVSLSFKLKAEVSSERDDHEEGAFNRG